MVGLTRAHATLRRTSFFDGGGDPPDIAWFDERGQPMGEAAWSDPSNHFIAYLLAGDQADEPDDDVLIVVNAALSGASFTAPGLGGQQFTLAARHRRRRRPAGVGHDVRSGLRGRGRAANGARRRSPAPVMVEPPPAVSPPASRLAARPAAALLAARPAAALLAARPAAALLAARPAAALLAAPSPPILFAPRP